MKCIVAADKNWGIGKNNELLVRIPDDMKNFRRLTTGKVVVLGRKTLETFPNGRPLKNRTNIIMSRNEDYKVEDAIIAHSEDELMDILKNYDSDDVYVIGGGKIYDLLIPYCNEAVVTKLDDVFESDTYFPDLDADEEWMVQDASDEMEYDGLGYRFVTYKKK